MIRKLFFLMLALPAPLMAQRSAPASTDTPSPVVMIIVLGALTLAPFVLIMLTSFVKISVVLSILRNALGTQSVPPNQVITGLAFVLSLFIMTPVAQKMYADAGSINDTRDIFSEASVRSIFEAAQRGKEPLRRFLAKHSHDQDRLLFMDLATRLDQSADGKGVKLASNSSGTEKNQAGNATALPVSYEPAAEQETGSRGDTEARGQSDSPIPAVSPNQPESQAQKPPAPPTENKPALDKDDFRVVIPAFVTSQLKEAFEIGFLVFIPFIIIDMVIANVLLAMGMSMLSPSVISLPFKLLLFVLVDGWFLIVRGLVLSYA